MVEGMSNMHMSLAKKICIYLVLKSWIHSITTKRKTSCSTLVHVWSGASAWNFFPGSTLLMDTGKPMPVMERNHVKSSFGSQLRGFCKAHFISSLCVSSLSAWSSWLLVVLAFFSDLFRPGSWASDCVSLPFIWQVGGPLFWPSLACRPEAAYRICPQGGWVDQTDVQGRCAGYVAWPIRSKLTLSCLPSLTVLSTHDLWVMFDLWLEKNI